MPIERHLSLITLDGVKDLIARDVSFRCRYELVGGTGDGKPRYRCIYTVGDEELVLVVTKVRKHGPEIKLFALWPGLVNHHVAFGDGAPVRIDLDIRNAPENETEGARQRKAGKD